MLAVVVLPLLLLLADIAVRRSAKPAPAAAAGSPEPARFAAADVTAPAPSAFPAGQQPGTIKPGQGMVYRGPVAARR